MFASTADVYDALYVAKDYEGEAARAIAAIEARLGQRPRTLLDVACGTGRHAAAFAKRFEVDGVDADEGLLEVARRRYPTIRFHAGDMTSLELGRRFDVVTCLYGSIAYVRELASMRRAVAAMAKHVEPGGLMLLEPWHLRERYVPKPEVRHVDLPDVKIARLSRATVSGTVADLEVHYLVGRADAVEHRVEHHVLGLFSNDEHVAALEAAGLTALFDPEGLAGRGMYVGVGPGP